MITKFMFSRQANTKRSMTLLVTVHSSLALIGRKIRDGLDQIVEPMSFFSLILKRKKIQETHRELPILQASNGLTKLASWAGMWKVSSLRAVTVRTSIR